MKILFVAAIALTALWLAIAIQPTRVSDVKPYSRLDGPSKLRGYQK